MVYQTMVYHPKSMDLANAYAKMDDVVRAALRFTENRTTFAEDELFDAVRVALDAVRAVIGSDEGAETAMVFRKLIGARSDRVRGAEDGGEIDPKRLVDVLFELDERRRPPRV
jgi:Arc/MetJ-type ribon-helix-helix transcriptional regulator